MASEEEKEEEIAYKNYISYLNILYPNRSKPDLTLEEMTNIITGTLRKIVMPYIEAHKTKFKIASNDVYADIPMVVEGTLKFRGAPHLCVNLAYTRLYHELKASHNVIFIMEAINYGSTCKLIYQ